jgi:uncharacterized protein YbjQ (UPF0145 family)
MILSTLMDIPGRTIKEILGIVKGNTVRARHLGRDIAAGLKHLVGGEIEQYTKLLDEARQEAVNRMVEDAVKLQADAIMGIRFSSSSLMQGASEILVYGTAVRLKR